MSFSPQRPDGLRGDELPQLLTAVPGPSSVAWVERLSQVECPAITARRDRRRADGGSDPIVWAAARGAVVVDTDGNRFVDLSGGFGVGLVGHAHPLVVEAAQRQLHQLVHGMGDLVPSREKSCWASAWPPSRRQTCNNPCSASPARMPSRLPSRPP
jgi:4-aminobutyrate aminotransferase-like enzyme